MKDSLDYGLVLIRSVRIFKARIALAMSLLWIIVIAMIVAIVLLYMRQEYLLTKVAEPMTITYLYKVDNPTTTTIKSYTKPAAPKPTPEKETIKPIGTWVTASMRKPTAGKTLTKSGGVFHFDGRKETWYSQKVLSGGGLTIPGRHVGNYGLIKDINGFIVVAASDLRKGTVVLTSLGYGKVYDTGCAVGTTDIYTNW